jgi:hypothetical protein
VLNGAMKRLSGIGRFFDFKKQTKTQKSAIVLMWHLAIFLTKCLTCANGGNQISKYFSLVPPSLEEYISNMVNF